jgi:hypothetical protein
MRCTQEKTQMPPDLMPEIKKAYGQSRAVCLCAAADSGQLSLHRPQHVHYKGMHKITFAVLKAAEHKGNLNIQLQDQADHCEVSATFNGNRRYAAFPG